jgi:hypothetical protein
MMLIYSDLAGRRDFLWREQRTSRRPGAGGGARQGPHHCRTLSHVGSTSSQIGVRSTPSYTKMCDDELHPALRISPMNASFVATMASECRQHGWPARGLRLPLQPARALPCPCAFTGAADNCHETSRFDLAFRNLRVSISIGRQRPAVPAARAPPPEPARVTSPPSRRRRGLIQRPCRTQRTLSPQ